MTPTLAWAVAGLGLVGLAIERRRTAIALVTLEALILAVASGELLPGAILAGRAALLGALLYWTVRRTTEDRPLPTVASPLVRLALGIALALVLASLVPSLALSSRDAERAALALLAFGLATAILRRSTLHQIAGIVTIENGVALAALAAPGGATLAIELGAAVDLVFVAVVALVLHDRVFQALGTSDAARLGSLRD
jgi:hydrogenase-4 membrane subunit HyfE